MFSNQSIRTSPLYDIDRSLKEMFANKSRPIKKEALKAIMNTRMAESVSIREHMLKMIDTFEEANAKLKVKCFKCRKKDYWKKECSDFLTKNISTILFLESILMVGSSFTYIIDSRATNHVYITPCKG
jgi:hypothetical protein